MGFGTGLGIALGAGADAYRKQTAFDTDQQYQQMLMANQKNEIDSRNAVQKSIQSLAPVGSTEYAQGTDQAGNTVWGSQAPATQNAQGAPAPQAMPTAGGSPAPPASIAAPTSGGDGGPMAGIGALPGVPAMPSAMPTVMGGGNPTGAAAMPPSAIVGTDPSAAQAPAAPAGVLPSSTAASPSYDTSVAPAPAPQAAPAVRTRTAQQQQLDIANIYMQSGVPSLIAAGGEIQNNALNTQLTQQKIAAGNREEANAQLQDTLTKSRVLAESGDGAAALQMAFSALPGHTGLSVAPIKADGPAGTEDQYVMQVYGPDHQPRYTLPAGTPSQLIDRMSNGLLNPEARSKVELQKAQALAAEASARGTDEEAKHTQALLDAGMPAAQVASMKASASEAYAQGQYLSTESTRNNFMQNARNIADDPKSTPAQRQDAINNLQMAQGIFPGATVVLDPTTGQLKQTRVGGGVAPENQNLIFSPSMNTWVNPGTLDTAIAATPEWRANQVTLGRDPKTNVAAYRAQDGTMFPRFSDAQSYARGYAQLHPVEKDKPKVKGRTGGALPDKTPPVVGRYPGADSAADVGDSIHAGIGALGRALSGPLSSGSTARFGLPTQ
jgi:hypothetical protein